MGFYACHLAHWLQHFDLRQFLILALEEDIAAQPEATVLKVQSFLGLTRHDLPATVKRVVNGGLPRIWRDDVLYVSPPRGSEEPVMTLDTVRRLRDIYRADVQALERLIDRPISKQWLTANSLQ